MAMVANTADGLAAFAEHLPSWLRGMVAAQLRRQYDMGKLGVCFELWLYDGAEGMTVSALMSDRAVRDARAALSSRVADLLVEAVHASRDEFAVMADRLDAEGHTERAHMWRMLIQDYRQRIGEDTHG